MGVSRMWMGGYDGMDIYSSLGETPATVLLARSVGSQKEDEMKVLKHMSEK
jgi:hypothetical protein